MPNYIYYDYCTSRICKVKEAHCTYTASPNIKSYLNDLCLKHGSTFEGRKKAFQYVMNKNRFIPIVISADPLLVFFPIDAINDPNCIWISYSKIDRIIYHKKKCEIYFKDSTQLLTTHPARIEETIHSIWRYLQITKSRM